MNENTTINTQTKWRETAKKELETAKYLKKGTKVIVDAKIVPRETTVEGRYGKRKMYIVNTMDYGLIYVSQIQLVHIADVLEGSKFHNVTVEL